MAWVTVWGGIWCRPMTSWSSLIPSGYNSAVAGLSQCHEKLLGYFCAEDCSIPVGGFAETAVDMVRPPPGCLVRRTDAGMEQNLLAVYWLFLGCFCPMGDNLGRVGQSMHFMQIAQSRINTGDSAYR